MKRICPRCNGTGEILLPVENPWDYKTEKCPDCKGKGSTRVK